MGDQTVAQSIIIDPLIYTLIRWSIPRGVYKTIMTIARTTDQFESLRGAFNLSIEYIRLTPWTNFSEVFSSD